MVAVAVAALAAVIVEVMGLFLPFQGSSGCWERVPPGAQSENPVVWLCDIVNVQVARQ